MGNKDPLYAERVAARNRMTQEKILRKSQKTRRLANRALAAGEAEAAKIREEWK